MSRKRLKRASLVSVTLAVCIYVVADEGSHQVVRALFEAIFRF